MFISDYLRSKRVPFQALLHEPTPSATKLARSVHVPGRQVAKVVLIGAGDWYALAVLPSTHRVDLARLAELVGCSQVRLANEGELERIFNDCELGALPPFGRLYGLQTWVDTSLAGDGCDIVFEGNLRHLGMRMSFRDYQATESPRLGQFAVPIAPRRPRSSHRHAG